ncbi:GntR family transcriptional regulator [Glycomyces amatae]|uniref:GntR family transcriptional regulator n=1 Tax=Glycomyces amatae TaxID=2881355 RepID=UPI0034E19B44
MLSGALTQGCPLPSQRELAVRYGVARNTAAEAVKILESEGLIESRNRARPSVRKQRRLLCLGAERYSNRLRVETGLRLPAIARPGALHRRRLLRQRPPLPILRHREQTVSFGDGRRHQRQPSALDHFHSRPRPPQRVLCTRKGLEPHHRLRRRPIIFSPWNHTEIANWGGLACLAAAASYGISYVYIGKLLGYSARQQANSSAPQR